MIKKYYVFGASGHGKVVLDMLISNEVNVAAIIDDNPKAETLLNIPVLNTNDIKHPKQCVFTIAVGNNNIRKQIVEKNIFTFFNIKHKSASVSKFSFLGEGIVIMANAVVNVAAKIGNHCIINTGSVIEHDCILEDYVHISPNASLAGNVFVGEGSQVGIGATIIQGIKIGKWAVIGAGAVVIKDIPDYAVVVGNPAKVIKFNYQ